MNLCCGNLHRNQNDRYPRRFSTSTEEILNISPKEAKLISDTYNIEYACNQFIDKEDAKVTYTTIKNDLLSSINFSEISFVSPIHYSLCLGKRYCYRIVTTENEGEQRMIVFRCKNQKERDYWMKEIRCAMTGVTDFLITEENSLKIYIQECRNLAYNNKYFCEIKLDDLIYARSSVKEMREICFWGEEFDLTGLSDIKLISITVWRLPRDKERDSQIVSLVNISINTVNRHCITEKWYSPSPVLLPNLSEFNSLTFSTECEIDSPPDKKSKDKTLPNQVRDSAPLLRIKSRYFPLKVLDPKFYSEVLYFLEKNGVNLFRELDVNLKAKYREELVFPMVQLSIRKRWADTFLSELILKESSNCDINVILRGNSMATKAIECFLKIECADYLKEILEDMIKDIMYFNNDLEIDRARLLKAKVSVNTAAMKKRARKLENLLSRVFTKLFSSADIVPRRVKQVFSTIRIKLKNYEKSHSGFTEKVVSACFFLRLVCPAIMTPYLFQLLPDYSQNPAINRSFTLVAKCLQNVANFAGIDDQKEDYMQSMVLFCREYYNDMHNFLEKISTYDDNSAYESSDRNMLPNYDQIGFGMEMARLCYHVDYCLSTFSDENSTQLECEAKELISQLKHVETQLSAGTDTMEMKYSDREFTESGKPIQNTIESSGYFSMHDYPVSGSNKRPSQPTVTSYAQPKMVFLKNTPKTYLPTLNGSPTISDHKNEEVLSLRKIIELEKNRLLLLEDIAIQYPDAADSEETPIDFVNLNFENSDIIASSKFHLQSYIEFANQCLISVEKNPDCESSHGWLEKVIKINSSLQITLVKYSKEIVK